MMTLYPKLIMDALATVTYAGTKKNLVESGMVADTPSINGMKVKVVLEFPRDTDPFLKSTVKAAEAAIHYHISPEVEVEIVTEFKSKPRPEVDKLLPQVKNIIAVSSGKGGVASLPFLPTSPSPWLVLAIRWDCLIPISSAPQCLRCLMPRTSVPMLSMWMAATSSALSRNTV